MTLESTVVSLLGLFLLMYLTYWYLTKEFNYWKDRNVPFIKPTALFGSVKDQILRRSSWMSFISQSYKDFKHHGFGGAFFMRSPILWVCDPKLIEHVLVEDFTNFHDRWSKIPWSNASEAGTLMLSRGERWRSLRLKIAPAFASVKVKGMYHQIMSSTDNVLQRIKTSDTPDGVDVETLTTDFATEVLASCLCGVQMSNSVEAIEFTRAIDMYYKPSLGRNLAIVLYCFFPPKLLKCIGIRAAPQEAIDILTSVIRSILNYRKRSGERRNDVLQTMLDLKEQEEREDKPEEVHSSRSKIRRLVDYFQSAKRESNRFFTEEKIAAQIMGFMSGGIKPLSVTITFALFEIAKNPSIQKKLQLEVDSVTLKHKEWGLEALKEMAFLDQVIQETLRLYSANVILMRAINENCKIPGTEATLDKNMQVFITADGLHKDPDLYPCPLEFRPERWQGNNFRTSSTYLPFGHGPRICISIRLAVLTMKLCLARVVAQHRVSISHKMVLPLQFDDDVHFKAKDGVWLKFTDRVL